MSDNSRSEAFSRSQTIVRSLTRVGRTMRGQLWIWPLLAAAVLMVAGWLVNWSIESTIKRQLASSLETMLQADVEALEIWFGTQEAVVHSAAESENVAARIRELVQPADSDVDGPMLVQSAALENLRNDLRPWLTADGAEAGDEKKAVGAHAGFVVLDRQRRVIAADRDDVILLSADPQSHAQLLDDRAQAILDRVFDGHTVVTPPFESKIVLTTETGEARAGVPTMFALAPVRDEAGSVVAALGLRIRPEQEFTRILSIAQPGQSGETYAFSREGLLLSQSRFDDQLKTIGLLVDREDVKSILNLEVRDPQVDMTQGARPKMPRRQQPLTRMAAAAVQGKSGCDVDGYRDYRGARVVGAWRWLPEHQLGVATEVGTAEAFRPLLILRWSFGILLALLAAAAVVIFLFMRVANRMQLAARQAALKAKALGQYQLDDKIGEGGMGVVYRAHHAMLRRPTAVKLLSPEKTNEDSIARFEREVQLTSRLNHPNTIQIYDYGRTPEGVFYCAMELLDGLPLDVLVERYGPQCEGRVVSILAQICHSLAEAHGVGLIHRDVKPANIMLCQRGGVYDFVKVLDFGLVKAVAEERQITLTAAGAITGTPLFLSPEGIERPDDVDARSDLYAVGAVGYFLLTGTPVFLGKSLTEVCMQQVKAAPEPPSQRLGSEVSERLEALLLRCLAKEPAERFQSAEELLEELAACEISAVWTTADARQWWQRRSTASKADTAQLARTMLLE